MADRFAGKISIGGHVSNGNVKALIKAIYTEGINLYPEWSDKIFSPKKKQDLINALDESGHLVLCDDQSRNGMFDDLEDSLTALGVAWSRWSGSYCEYGAEIVWWQPGMDAPDGFNCDNDGNELVAVEPVKKAYALLRHYFSECPGSGDPEMSNDAMQQLASIITEVPVLPPLEFEN